MFNSWWLSETRPSELKESKPFPWPVQPESLPCTRNAHNGKLSMVEHGAHRDFTRLRLSEFTIWAFSVLHVRQSELFIRRRIHLPVFLSPEKPLFVKINARANSFTFDTHSGRPCILQCKVKYMLGQFNGPRSSWIEGSARSLNHCIVGTFQTNVICCLLRMPREKILHSSAAWLESKVGTLFL